ncbi:hypothetical protein CAPTEDRAFT_221529 [Capitella teleta]|uniref:TIR domain-containing protein n=1 Tax=Capitella teleta TaxID=283909 RepID=R7TDW0_CAPTE|nr:hypothetical protein CAPTEDRAFT_221529 [Capitella teleta]|eukprot:ELT89677.1 hypothetical protein CAPTEDRAFT_221529 [Capitella teleta]
MPDLFIFYQDVIQVILVSVLLKNLRVAGIMTSSNGSPDLKSGEKHHVFMSHGSSDQERALEILEKLEKKGFKCCYPNRDFQPGMPVLKLIIEGIQNSQKVVLLVSKNFLKSSYMEFEVAEASRKMYSEKKVTLIPLLMDVDIVDVPTSIKAVNCIEMRKAGWFDRLIEGLKASSTVTDLITPGDIGHGLAWSYYYGYLKLILPGLRQRVNESEFAKSGTPFLKKFIAILPETSICPSSFDKEDENVKTIGAVEFSVSISGNVMRNYKTAVHQVTDPRDKNKTYLFLGEFCTPLRSLYEMASGGIAGLSNEGRNHQSLLFREKLKEILGHPNAADCKDFVLLPYRDVAVQSSSEVHEKESLSQLLCDMIEYELKIEAMVAAEASG